MKLRDILLTVGMFLAFGIGMILGSMITTNVVEQALTAGHRIELDRLGDRLSRVQARFDEAMRWLTFEGRASWYGDFEDGQPTANKETFDKNAMTAASPWLPSGPSGL